MMENPSYSGLSQYNRTGERVGRVYGRDMCIPIACDFLPPPKKIRQIQVVVLAKL